jgi:hypothetical protein
MAVGFKELGVDEAISEAEYGIKRMKENAAPFDFYLKGTLASLKGALDYLLEEYNAKYSVGIGDKEDLNVRSFKDRVKGGKHPRAESFIDSYVKEKKKLFADPKCEKLLARYGSRDITIHRKQLQKNINLTLYEHITASVRIEVKDGKGNLVSTGGSPAQPVTVRPPEIQYFLSDWKSDDIPTLCEYTLNEVKKFVSTLRANHT